MNDLQEFEFEGQDVRTVADGDQVWFAARDVTDALGLTNTTVAISSLDPDEVTKFNLGSRSGDTNFISEPGLYRLIGASRKPAAKRFNRWVTHDVLPSIRKHGAYMTGETIENLLANPENGAKLLLTLSQERKAHQKEREARQMAERQVEVMAPKALFADAVATSDSTILVRELAKVLKQNGIDMGEKRLFAWLRDNGYLIRHRGADYNSPTQRAMELGLFRIKETAVNHSNGIVTVTKTPKVTGRGQQYFVEKLLPQTNLAVTRG
ncbi:phage antirepressor [Lacticaseibacillus nasuensis]|uniref:Antirepressor protein n=1 Tax=Lacticaseibacillus nasuensis JCM 17158 TaxID=1291734 RepID=A0A0R1JU86_9LACO|nr:phage antirepressor KilAC domain-containing protein [Lacticaseibacillus nasuensis]KRK71889.1 antirepressor protein [Lacticaseibacillus nasuensis JCM 17158]